MNCDLSSDKIRKLAQTPFFKLAQAYFLTNFQRKKRVQMFTGRDEYSADNDKENSKIDFGTIKASG